MQYNITELYFAQILKLQFAIFNLQRDKTLINLLLSSDDCIRFLPWSCLEKSYKNDAPFFTRDAKDKSRISE